MWIPLLLLTSWAQQPAFKLVGDAYLTGSIIHLTPPRQDQTGAAWVPQPQPLTTSFQATFTFQIIRPAQRSVEGSDGFAFVIQNVGPKAIGGRGSSGGFSIGRGDNPPDRGIPRSLAVFFDTHRNHEEGDPSDNSIGVFTNGDGEFPPRRIAILKQVPVRLNDGRPHAVEIRYQRPTFEVRLDGNRVLSVNVSLEAILGSAGQGYPGFTASTGSGYQQQDILDWQFKAPTESEAVSSTLKFHDDTCLPGRTLCTPREPVLTALDARRWHVVLPAHRPGSVAIPNPANAQAVVTNALGTICWHAVDRGGYSCHGPEGNASGRGKLTSSSKHGRLQFSIDTDPKTDSTNEGYFEFDVELKPPTP